MESLTPESLGRLLDAHAAALELYAAQWTAWPGDAVQDAFIELFRQTRPPAATVPWLYRVVRNRALNAARAARRRRQHESVAADMRQAWFQPSESSDMDAEEATEALRQLPTSQREVIIARLWGGLSFEEIGEVTGTSSSTACRRYQTGIAALRRRLGTAWLGSGKTTES
jgi:RNA polymerase sigma-70 factor (ECF subfamily)